jgi:choline dehydrogenase
MTEADPTRHGKVDLWPRGKVLGGSSAINGTIYVRGNRGDYDRWAKLGNTGWGYDDILPYFRKIECNKDGVSDVYGKDGPIVISQTRGPPRLAHIFIEAMAELGFPPNPDYNGENQLGASITHATHNKGWRCSAAKGYLHPVRRRANLKIATHAFVTRIRFDGRRAIGVEFMVDGQQRYEAVTGEVILSASAINSPKLLMFSGLGPAEHLRKLGIPVVRDIPGVGQNLSEHPCVHVKGLVTLRTSNMDASLFGQLKHGVRFALTGGGPASYVLPALAFVKTRPELDYPDLQFHFGAFGYDFAEEGPQMLDRPTVTLQPNINRPRSRGYLELRSADPKEPPAIHPNMLAERYDIETLIAGGRLGRAALRTKAFSAYFLGEYAPGEEVQSDDEWEDYVRQNAAGVYHPNGTCKMGVDPMAVVDPRLRVIGVAGLRVIDSSVIPQLPSANINAITMVIGEKGADMIRKDATARRAG